MPGRDILFDLTEFLHDPQRSGIQRVCYEIVAHWPSTSRLIPACVDEHSRLRALPPETLDIYRAYFLAAAPSPRAGFVVFADCSMPPCSRCRTRLTIISGPVAVA